MDVHHIVFDGTSLHTFLHQVIDVYEGREIPDKQMTLFEVAESERNLKSSATYAEARDYFREKFSGIEYDSAIIPDVNPAEVEHTEGIVTLDFNSILDCNAIDSFVKKNGIKKSTLFTAAFAYCSAQKL